MACCASSMKRLRLGEGCTAGRTRWARTRSASEEWSLELSTDAARSLSRSYCIMINSGRTSGGVGTRARVGRLSTECPWGRVYSL